MPNVSSKLYKVSNLKSIQEYNYKISASQSKIISPVKSVWLEAIEILELSSKCIKDLDGAPYVEAD